MSTSAPRVYRADNRFDCGWFGAPVALYRELRANWRQIGTIFMKDFRAAYRGAALGVFWNFALPLLPITAYILLATLRVFPTRDGLPAAVFIAVGVTLWALMADLISSPIKIVKSRTREVMKTALPLSASIASSFAMTAFETLIRIIFVLFVAVIYQTAPAATAPIALLVVLLACLFSLSIGVALSILNTVAPDIERVVTVVLRYGIFLSGVIFPLSVVPGLVFLETWNPFAVYITALRDILFFGALSNVQALAGVSAIAAILSLVAARLFWIMEYRIRGFA